MENKKHIFRKIVDTVPGFVYQIRFRKDGSRYWSYISPKGSKMLGLEEDFIGKSNIAEFDKGEERTNLMNSIEESVRNLTEWDYEYKFRKPNGEEIWLHCTGMPVKEGDEVAVNGVLQDITAKKETERLLVESEQKFNRAFFRTPYPVYMTSLPDGVFIEVNNAFLDISGYTSKELLGKPVLDFDFYLNPEERKKLTDTLSRDKRLHDYRIQFRVKSGDLRDCSLFSEIIEIGGKPALITTVRDMTEQNLAEKALISSEVLYRSLFENATDSIFLMKGAEFVQCNQKTLEIFGCNRMEDIIGKSPMDFSPEYQLDGELTSEKASRKLKAALNGVPQRFDWQHTKLNGGIFFAEIHLTRMQLDTEVFLLAIVRDITRRKNIENELIELQEYLQLQIERMPLASIIWDKEFRASSWNPSAEEIFGFSEEVALGKPPYDLIVPESRKPIIKAEFASLLNGDETANSLNENITSDGRTIICHWSNTPLKRQDGTIIGVLSMVQDVTEKTRAEEELKTYQNYLEELVRERTTELEVANINLDEKEKSVRLLSEITSALNLADDPEEAIFFAIERMSVYTGWPFGHMIYIDEESGEKRQSGIWYTDDNIRDEKIPELLSNCKFETEFCPINLVLKSKKPLVVKHQEPYSCSLINVLVDKHGLTSSFVFPIEIESRIIGVIQFLYKENETAGMLFSDLAQQISIQIGIAIERKRIREELVLEKERAEDANRSKSQFLANMSHEIRTPMNSILGFASILSSRIESQRDLDYLESIKSSGKNLLELINDILDLSKIEAGKLNLDMREIHTPSFFNEIISLFEQRISEKGLSFEVEIDENVPPGINTDELRLKQIILNLLSNAVKFTEEGAIIYSVRSEKIKKKRIDLVIEVKDSGIGISEEFKDKLFDTFQQEDGRLTRKFEGTGLGLSITRKLVELLNGDIVVESEVGKGSTFTVRLRGVKISKSFSENRPLEDLALDKVQFAHATVLLVEDNTEDQKYFGDLLTEAGLRVILAKDGKDALRVLDSNKPALIITDLRMPVMDGYELFDKLKEVKDYKKIPVIAITASAMKEEIDRIKSYGFPRHLIKPVEIPEFIRCLMGFLPHKLIKESEDYNKLSNHEISEAARTHLTKVIKKLDTKYFNDWQKLKKKQPLDKVEEFGRDLQLLGKENRLNVLEAYGKSLLDSVESFNVQEIKNDINKFPELLNFLKKIQ